MKSLLLLVCFAGLVSAEAEAEADPACNNCGQRPPYIKGARVSNFNNNNWYLLETLFLLREEYLF